MLGRRREAEGNRNQGTMAGLPGEVWVGGSVSARVCVSLNVCVQYFGTFPLPPLQIPWRAIPTPTLLTEGNRGQSRAAGPGEVSVPKFGACKP